MTNLQMQMLMIYCFSLQIGTDTHVHLLCSVPAVSYSLDLG